MVGPLLVPADEIAIWQSLSAPVLSYRQRGRQNAYPDTSAVYFCLLVLSSFQEHLCKTSRANCDGLSWHRIGIEDRWTTLDVKRLR